MKKGKIAAVCITAVIASSFLAGCGQNDWDENATEPKGEITAVSREDGSGTRGSFVELIGLEKDVDGETFDMTTPRAEVTNSTAVMITSVSGNKSAVGYISLGSMSDMVKPIKVDGVMPSIETIKNGSYKIARPFNIVYSDSLSSVGKDFINFIMSDRGQDLIEEEGYVSQDNQGEYEPSQLKGHLAVSGSSSVAPVMEVLAEKYEKLNPSVSIDVQESDSTTGINTVQEGVSDIGLSSRNLNDSELTGGITSKTIAMDGIVVIVNHKNPIDNLTTEQLNMIYSGEAQKWEDVL